MVRESEWEPYDRFKHTGMWRLLMYKESAVTKECLVCVVVSETEEEKVKEGVKETVGKYFKEGD